MRADRDSRIGAIAVALLLTAIPAVAQVTARIEPDTVRVGEPFLLRVEAKGGDVDEPEIPSVDGLQISLQPRLRNDLITIVNFSKERTKVRGYSGRATRPGTFTIPPVKVRIDGRMHESPAVVLTVTDGATSGRRRQPDQGDQNDQSDQPAPPETPQTAEDPPFVILDAQVSRTEAYVNEPIILTLERWILDHRQVAIRGAEPGDPATEGFYVIPVTRRRSPFDANIVERDGYYYQHDESLRILYPTSAGELTIGPWAFEGAASIHEGFRTYRRDIYEATAPIAVTVRPLPTAPPGFTGGVGRFTVSADLSQASVVQGVPAKLELRVAGVGNPDAVGAPRSPKVDGGSVTAPVSEVRWSSGDDMPQFTKTFTYGITLSATGDVTIPAIDFCYFDPEAETYRTDTLGPFTISVQPAQDAQNRVIVDAEDAEPRGDVEVVGQDIRPILTEMPAILTPPSTPMVALAAGAPPIAFAAWALALRRRRRYRDDVPYARSRRAKTRARHRLEAARNAADPQEGIYRALTGFVSDKLGTEAGGATSDDVRGLLDGRELDDELVQGVLRILRTIERARYGSTRLSDAETAALTDAARNCIDAMDAAFARQSDGLGLDRLRLRALLHRGMRSGVGSGQSPDDRRAAR